jgi:hypothetical protein
MKVFVYGFWSGFIEKTNPTDISFFIDLFKLVFNEEIELGEFHDSDILLETIFDKKTFLYEKQWKYSFLFSGESRLNEYYKDYSCVLYGERNHDNIINVPLFIPMMYCSKLTNKLTHAKSITYIPEKNICTIISNPSGQVRNHFLNELEKSLHVDYGGNYKTNISIVKAQYNTQEFTDFVSQYKFIVSMENSRGETYITEKILHGFYAGTIPIYWGSSRVCDYFNSERFLNISDISDTPNIIQKVNEILNDDNKFLEIVNKPIFNNNKLDLDINEIANNIKNLIFQKKYPLITKIFAINSPEFEPLRYKLLNNLFTNLGCKDYNVKYICPTYKQTITDEIMNTHVKYNLVKRLRINGMKRSEISLFLNYKAVLKNIVENYSDGLFLIFESDIITKNNIDLNHFEEFISSMYSKKDNWDLIHIGRDLIDTGYFDKPYCDCILPYRDKVFHLPETFVEDITNPNDKFRLVRKFHTRCCDSFLWNYKGVKKFYKYMCDQYFYDAPFDYYLTNFLENTLDFKHYWSLDTFFIQGSNYGIYESTIQKDEI